MELKHASTTDTQKKEPEKSVTESDTFYKTVIVYGILKISIPKEFSELTTELINFKYPKSSSRPDKVFSNKKANINIGFNYSQTPASQDALPELQKVVTAQLQATNPENLRSRIENINGRNYVVLEFISKAIDTKIYNLMFLTDVNGRLFLGTLNCVIRLQSEWEPKLKYMLSSIRM